MTLCPKDANDDLPCILRVAVTFPMRFQFTGKGKVSSQALNIVFQADYDILQCDQNAARKCEPSSESLEVSTLHQRSTRRSAQLNSKALPENTDQWDVTHPCPPLTANFASNRHRFWITGFLHLAMSCWQTRALQTTLFQYLYNQKLRMGSCNTY